MIKPARKYICDFCERQWSFSDEPLEDALRSLSQKGWVIFDDGRIICEECYTKLLVGYFDWSEK